MSADAPSIAIVTDDAGWHGAQLRRWFAARGVTAIDVSLTACHIELTEQGAGIVVPGFATLPHGVFVRGVPGGSLEAITLRLGILHHLAHLGCVVMNSARAIERTVDKGMTSLLLRAAAVPTPRTFVCESFDQTRDYVVRELACGRTLVKKPLFGSQGRGLRRIVREDDLGYLLPGEIAYLQEFIAPRAGTYRDYRIMVVDGRAVAAMERVSDHWITNRAQGARCRRWSPPAGVDALAEAAAIAIEVDYAGVDLMQDRDGRWLVTEVNGIPAWQGVQRASGVNVTELLGMAMLDRVLRQRRPRD
jgi:tetrahydromethanopterin:alpha-L-glutamate ligase